MYHDLLGRAPSDTEVNTWLQVLSQGTSTEAVAYGFAASAEREGIRVRDDYFRYLGRTPSPGEVDVWVRTFANGLTNEGLVAGFLASLEYYNASSKGNGDKADWLTSAFLDVLGRGITAAEFNSWGGMLQ
jgi:hypothetical protein